MPVSGLLLTLSKEPVLQEQALAQLPRRPELEIGRLAGHWLPVAVDASDDAQCRELHDWMLSCPGVEFVDVVSVNFEEDLRQLAEVPAGAESPADSKSHLNSIETESKP